MGRYNKLVNDITKEVFNKIKQPTKVYKILPRKRIPKMQYIGKYSIPGGFEFDVWLCFIRSIRIDGCYVNGSAYSESDMIEVDIFYDPNNEELFYDGLRSEIKCIVRHEIEHLTHFRGGYQLGYKRVFNSDEKRRNAINIYSNEEYYKYFLLPSEVDANIHGFYTLAKDIKKPYNLVVSDWLGGLIESGEITLPQAKRIFNKMKKRIKEIGGIPPLNNFVY